MKVFGFGKREERKTAANKPGLSQLMAIVGAYVRPLAVPVPFLFPLQSILRKADIFLSWCRMWHIFHLAVAYKPKPLKQPKTIIAAWQDHKNESTSALGMAQFYFPPAMLP